MARAHATSSDDRAPALEEELRTFHGHGTATAVRLTHARLADGTTVRTPTFVNEFWTSRQRAAHSLHEISYRACFKPQLPRFFIERLTAPGDRVYDPFMGRGTTVLEAALLDRRPAGCDVNPLSRVLVAPRLAPPTVAEIREALSRIDLSAAPELPRELLVFYHPDTLRQLCALREHLLNRDDGLSPAESWIRMVAVNRLTGHSPGFFSAYTLPPNQAVSIQSQRRINERRGQVPPPRDVAAIVLRKSQQLLRGVNAAARERLRGAAAGARLLCGPAARTPEIAAASVDLVVTSPPFLDVVDYATDNWLRCWFCGIALERTGVTVLKRLDAWEAFVADVLRELRRVVRPGGHVAFEVGEVRGGAVRLEEHVIAAGVGAGLEPRLVLVNQQVFTKTANCWGVSNNTRGTNSNRIVLFTKQPTGA